MNTEHPDDIVCLLKAANPAEAHILQNALEEEGIQCHVVGDYLDAGIGDVPGMRAELWVHQPQLEKAKRIIEEHQNKK